MSKTLADYCFLVVIFLVTMFAWGIEDLPAGTTPIEVNTEQGGDIHTVGEGDPFPTDPSDPVENVNGAMFWNGIRWVTNDTAAHAYFTDLRTGQRLKVHNQTTVDSDTGQLGAVSGLPPEVQVVKNIYTYSIPGAAPASNPYTYHALEYVITWSARGDEGTAILRSRGTGNGTSQSYFDVYVENKHDSIPITTAMRGDPVWYSYDNMTAAEAVNETDDVAGRCGYLFIYSSTNPGRNNYWMDINGGSDMGGETYQLITGSIDPATIPTQNSGMPFIVQVILQFTDGSGQIQDIIFHPAIQSETGGPPPEKLTIKKIKGALNFKREGADSISVQGSLTFRQDIFLAGQTIAYNIAGASGAITLDQKEKSPKGNAKITFKVKKHKKGTLIPAGTAAIFSLKLAKQDLLNSIQLKGLGDPNTTTPRSGAAITYDLALDIGPQKFADMDVTGIWKATKDKKGQLK